MKREFKERLAYDEDLVREIESAQQIVHNEAVLFNITNNTSDGRISLLRKRRSFIENEEEKLKAAEAEKEAELEALGH